MRIMKVGMKMAQTELLNTTRPQTLWKHVRILKYLGRSIFTMEVDWVYFSMVLGYFLLSLCAPEVEAQKQQLFSALYIFGDSTIDPGNNNGLATIVKANFPPYGRDFPNAQPTAELSGLPDLLPASLDPGFQGEKLLTGASFGSSASGYANSTAHNLNVFPLKKQLDNFRQYKAQLGIMVGRENSNKIVSQALFAISTGTDDFALNYYLNPLMRKKYSVEQFQDLLIQSLSGFIQSVYSEGGTRLGIIGLPPFGCLPSQITLHNLIGNSCVEEFNQAASSFNAKIKSLIQKIQPNFPGFRIAYIDIYYKLADIVEFPSKYGFEEARKGCCGTGLLETAIICNKGTPTCPDASKYVFWDSIHPTTTAYNIMANDTFRQVVALLT